jgi:hypothetical protein
MIDHGLEYLKLKQVMFHYQVKRISWKLQIISAEIPEEEMKSRQCTPDHVNKDWNVQNRACGHHAL